MGSKTLNEKGLRRLHHGTSFKR